MRTPLTPALTLTAAATFLVGCVSVDRNARPVLAGTQTIPALAPPPADDQLPPLNGAPLVRIDRADWGPITYVAPFDGTVHPPIRRSYTRHTTDQTRAAGVAPTIDTALDLPGDQGFRPITETLAAHGIALIDVPMLVVRTILEPPSSEDVSPALLYKRTTPGAWRPGPAPITADTQPNPTTSTAR